jgi:hypothetical protein
MSGEPRIRAEFTCQLPDANLNAKLATRDRVGSRAQVAGWVARQGPA